MTEETKPNTREQLYLEAMKNRINDLRNVNIGPEPFREIKGPNDSDYMQELMDKSYHKEVRDRYAYLSIVASVAKDMGLSTKGKGWEQIRQNCIGECIRLLKPESSKTAIENISKKGRVIK